MAIDIRHPHAVALPQESRIAALFTGANLADAFAITLPSGSSRDIETLTRYLFGDPAPWITLLLGVRDTMVAGFGITTTRQLRAAPDKDAVKRVDIFRVYETHADEMILGEDDSHLDFRLSVLLRSAEAASTEIVVTTAVHCHNLVGRVYLTLIAPFHRRVARSVLARAASKGWPRDA